MAAYTIMASVFMLIMLDTAGRIDWRLGIYLVLLLGLAVENGHQPCDVIRILGPRMFYLVACAIL
jgi:hypothetical protein